MKFTFVTRFSLKEKWNEFYCSQSQTLTTKDKLGYKRIFPQTDFCDRYSCKKLANRNAGSLQVTGTPKASGYP